MTERERQLDELRPVAFAIAYRMLGSVAESEDVVQETLLRVHRALEEGQRIESPRAFAATVAAIEHGRRGIYNIVDDEPARVADWLPAAASAMGAPQPRRVPRWLGRILAGEAVTVMMTEIRGASNAKAKRELRWRPAHPSWRQGFAAA